MSAARCWQLQLRNVGRSQCRWPPPDAPYLRHSVPPAKSAIVTPNAVTTRARPFIDSPSFPLVYGGILLGTLRKPAPCIAGVPSLAETMLRHGPRWPFPGRETSGGPESGARGEAAQPFRWRSGISQRCSLPTWFPSRKGSRRLPYTLEPPLCPRLSDHFPRPTTIGQQTRLPGCGHCMGSPPASSLAHKLTIARRPSASASRSITLWPDDWGDENRFPTLELAANRRDGMAFGYSGNL